MSEVKTYGVNHAPDSCKNKLGNHQAFEILFKTDFIGHRLFKHSRLKAKPGHEKEKNPIERKVNRAFR